MPQDDLPPTFKPWHAPKSKALERKQDRARWRISPRKRGYNAHWDRLSHRFRRARPWCLFCAQELEESQWRPTAVADHVLPAHEFPNLRYDWNNLVGLCSLHHDSTKAKLEAYARKNNCLALLVQWVWDPMSRPVHLRPIAVAAGYKPPTSLPGLEVTP